MPANSHRKLVVHEIRPASRPTTKRVAGNLVVALVIQKQIEIASHLMGEATSSEKAVHRSCRNDHGGVRQRRIPRVANIEVARPRARKLVRQMASYLVGLRPDEYTRASCEEVGVGQTEVIAAELVSKRAI